MKYRKKPVVIEAFQFDGDFKDSHEKYYVPDWAVKAVEAEILFFEAWELYVRTLEGTQSVPVGNYIIQGVKGEIYSCDPEIFEMTYEEVGD